MIYATREDLVTVGIPEKALAGTTNDQRDAALSAASVQIDSYLARRFELPLTAAGDDIKQACVAIACYRLMARRGFSAGTADADQLRAGYEDAERWLMSVANGKVTPQYCVDGKGDSTNVSAPPRFVYQFRRDETSGEFIPTSSKTRGW